VSGRGAPKIARPRSPGVAKELRWRDESLKTMITGGARRFRWCYRKRELCTCTAPGSATRYYITIFYYYHDDELTHGSAVIFYISSTVRKSKISDAVAAERNARRNAPRPENCVSVSTRPNGTTFD